MMLSTNYQLRTAAETLRLIVGRIDPWLAIGRFLDDWRGMPVSQRLSVVSELLPAVPPACCRWAAFLDVITCNRTKNTGPSD
jgi:hypothetical protein